jgi:crotonobetainyl-CoA:carnitine CoA-transferase CaiB-like acyl-CoA transferase
MAPCRGQHTEEILRDFLEMSEAQVTALETE